MTRKIGREIGPGGKYFEESIDNVCRSPKSKKEKGPLGLGAEEVSLCHISYYYIKCESTSSKLLLF